MLRCRERIDESSPSLRTFANIRMKPMSAWSMVILLVIIVLLIIYLRPH